jgi:uncharacterized membrane protein
MNAFLSLGRWIFPLPFAIFGLLHMMNGQTMAGMVPSYLPMSVFWVYLTGLGMIAAAVSMYIGKYDKLGAALLAIFLLLVVFMIHVPGTMDPAKSQMAMPMLLKDLGLAGAAMMYAANYAKDRSIIG